MDEGEIRIPNSDQELNLIQLWLIRYSVIYYGVQMLFEVAGLSLRDLSSGLIDG